MTATLRPALPAVELGSVERALGIVVGRFAGVATLDRDSGRTPRQALEAVMLDALLRPPCLLSFSGGRDSSALLAVAVAVARREGLALPVPITFVFPGDVDADESDWQRRMLGHLGVSERLTVPVRDDLFDAVGPTAQQVLRRHGVLWPFNTHWHLPIVRQAAGGTVITGFGGDELAMSSSSLYAERALARRQLPTLTDLRAVAAGLSPRPVRFARRMLDDDAALQLSPWLTQFGRRRAHAALALDAARQPIGWGRALRGAHWRSRWVQATVRNTAAMAAVFDTRVVHPFVEPRVLQALAAYASFAGVGGRTELMRALFGDLLPESVVTRASKGTFNGALWTDTARQFAEGWTGAGVDPHLVDAEALRDAWSDRSTSAFAATLMQQAWLASNSKTVPTGAA